MDHVEEYKVPKMREDMDPEKQKLILQGCAPTLMVTSPRETSKENTIHAGKLIRCSYVSENFFFRFWDLQTRYKAKIFFFRSDSGYFVKI